MMGGQSHSDVHNIKARNSNLELLRIVSMVLICLHHFCVHGPWKHLASGYALAYLDAMSMGGKVGVDCFVLISGYFLVRSRFKTRSLLKLYLQITFYAFVILAAFVCADPSAVTGRIVNKSLNPVFGNLYWFMSAYVVLYLFVPIMNRALRGLPEQAWMFLLSMGFVVLSIVPTFAGTLSFASDVVWFMYLYALGGYMGIQSVKDADSKREDKSTLGWLNPVHIVDRMRPGICLIVMVVLLAISVIGIRYADGHFDWFQENTRMFLSMDSAFLLLLSIALFRLFEGLELGQRRWINTIAASTLGVYLIHDNPLVRAWLWPHFAWLCNASFPMLIGVSLLAPLAVYACCSAIDWARIHVIERPTMKFIDKHATNVYAIGDAIASCIQNGQRQ